MPNRLGLVVAPPMLKVWLLKLILASGQRLTSIRPAFDEHQLYLEDLEVQILATQESDLNNK